MEVNEQQVYEALGVEQPTQEQPIQEQAPQETQQPQAQPPQGEMSLEQRPPSRRRWRPSAPPPAGMWSRCSEMRP